MTDAFDLQSNERREVRIAFEGHEVLVRSNCDVALNRVGAKFRLLQQHSTPVTARSYVDVMLRDDGSYELTGGFRAAKIEPSFDTAVKYARVRTLQSIINNTPELAWIHGGAAMMDGRLTLIVGRWGSGKSTLVRSMCARGATFFSDDITPFDPENRYATAFPMTPANRAVRDDVDLKRSELANHPKSKWVPKSIAPPGTWVQPAAMIFPAFGASSAPAELQPMLPSTAAATLLEQTFSLGTDPSRSIAALTRLMTDVPLVALHYSSNDAATDLLMDFVTKMP